MTNGETWREEWDAYATEELRLLEAQPVTNLLAAIRRRQFGEYHVIWRVIAQRATLAEAGWTLYAVLESHMDYLPRYHCAAALLSLLDERDLTPVDLSGGDFRIRQNLPRIRERLEARIGPRPPNT